MFPPSQPIPERQLLPMLTVANYYQSKKVAYQFTPLEQKALTFFTNIDRKTFFVFGLPANVTASLLAMYSRLKNQRGIRGVWVDSFLPSLLAACLDDVKQRYAVHPDEKRLEAKFLKEHKITTLDEFYEHSEECRLLVEEFFAKACLDPGYSSRLSDSKIVQQFLSEWLDVFGHSSIARVGNLWLCCENISLLTAKSLEWARPGAGYIELSTRYVDMGGKEVYPIGEMLSVSYGADSNQITELMTGLFDSYRQLFGSNGNGLLPAYYLQQYGHLYQEDPSDLKMGVTGETSDVLGNLLPLSTLTSVAIACSGEAFGSILRHLLLDETPENLALAKAILYEAKKIGATDFTHHIKPGLAERRAWTYLDTSHFFGHTPLEAKLLTQIDSGTVTEGIQQAFSLLVNVGNNRTPSMKEISDWLFPKENGTHRSRYGEITPERRGNFTKLSREFEVASCAISAVMSMRSWRDLHRQGLSTHKRTFVTPYLGFYEYDKPHPPELDQVFLDAATSSREVYEELERCGVPPILSQYILPMGWNVGFLFAGNLRQLEFCIWQRTKPSANHEVRQIFRSLDDLLLSELTWWDLFSRGQILPAHRTKAYLFARSKSEMGRPLESLSSTVST